MRAEAAGEGRDEDMAETIEDGLYGALSEVWEGASESSRSRKLRREALFVEAREDGREEEELWAETEGADELGTDASSARAGMG
jgi:hypothetical protein